MGRNGGVVERAERLGRVTGWLRRAGHLRLEDGREVIWSVAEGRRGRRWREAVRTRQPGIRHSLLLEMDREGRFSHLELSTAGGLLTLHPEGDGTLHGNAVTTGGVRHIRGEPWDRDGIILIDGSIVSRLAAFPGLSAAIASGAERAILVVRVSRDLDLLSAREVVRRDGRRWSIGEAEDLTPDERGLLADQDWPLEEPAG
jgi:hypothetical protein